jgi:hypothetical protein
MSKKKLSEEVLNEIAKALSIHFEDELKIYEVDNGSKDVWHHSIRTDYLYKNRGVFKTLISNYRIEADVIQHKFNGECDKYRNGKVFRIYPHVSWEHCDGGTNGHKTDPDMIIIEKVLDHWNIEHKLRGE